ncbi:MAG: glycosyltransferase family 4 protein, partial [bacterium]
TFTGYVDSDKLPKIYNSIDALILASQWYEGFPMTIVEAFSNKTPVIGSNIGNIGNLIKDNTTGILFRYNSSESLINAIKRFEKSNIKMGSNAYDEYQKKYSTSSNYSNLMQIYRKICNIKKIFN